MLEHVVIVGASLAGLRAAETLRQEGFTGEITLIGDEVHRPYDRPPLSKKLLGGEWEPDRIALRKPDDLDGLGLEWRLGVRATGLDLGRRVVAVDGGGSVRFDGLVIATGASPRRLPGQADLDGVHTLRTLDDALALRAELSETPRSVVVIGAGFVGLEVAATARQLGHDVTVLEGAAAPLIRGLGATMGEAVAAVHGDHGVVVRCGVQVAGLEGDDTGRVVGVRLGDGELVPADVVLVGIGVAPNTAWLEGSGLTVRDGVVCDSTLSTGVPGVYAAGDVVRWRNDLLDAEVRIEHWTNAAEQGAVAGRNLFTMATRGEAAPYAAVPFFWSDQFEARIQFLGRAEPGDEVRIIAGDPAARQFAALYGRGGRLTAALGVSMPRLVMPFRKLLADRASWDEALAHAATLGG
jgi:NADPH-dependent 2,4-dienoyl-CoA reductase/sulfur reductase-like enzyme